jgi:hypothetical protein
MVAAMDVGVVAAGAGACLESAERRHDLGLRVHIGD